MKNVEGGCFTFRPESHSVRRTSPQSCTFVAHSPSQDGGGGSVTHCKEPLGQSEALHPPLTNAGPSHPSLRASSVALKIDTVLVRQPHEMEM